MSWATEKVRDQIAEMLAAGATGSEVGAAFGVTRNAAIGVIHRDPRLKAIGFKREGRNRTRRAAAKPVLVVPAPVDRASFGAPHTAGIPMLMLTAGRCKWCINDPEIGSNAHLFCGEVSAPGAPYCAFHATASISKGTESERTAVRSALKIAA